jgi:hypothetical protein
MSDKGIFSVSGPPEANTMNIEESIQATLDYAELMGSITEGLGIETEVESKLNEAVRLARLSTDNNLLKRASAKVIDHYRKLKNLYTAGKLAIESGQNDKALGFIRDLVLQQDWTKALDLARRMDGDVLNQTLILIDREQSGHDQERFAHILTARDNRYGLAYLVKSFDPDFQGVYYLKPDSTLGRNYELMEGFTYAGVTVKRDFLERFRHYQPQIPYRDSELIHRLYQMNEEQIRRKVHLIKKLDFPEIANTIDGFLSLVAINHVARSLLITEPIVRCIRRER